MLVQFDKCALVHCCLVLSTLLHLYTFTLVDLNVGLLHVVVTSFFNLVYLFTFDMVLHCFIVTLLHCDIVSHRSYNVRLLFCAIACSQFASAHYIFICNLHSHLHLQLKNYNFNYNYIYIINIFTNMYMYMYMYIYIYIYSFRFFFLLIKFVL